MIIDVVLNNDFNTGPKHTDVSKYVCGVIDVIRATTTISVMLAKGANEIVIAKNKFQAFSLKRVFKDYLLCGEEGGHPPKGFDFGNSPLEYSRMNLEGKGIILKTTNGTKSFFKTVNSKCSFALSMVNINYTCDAMISEAQKNDLDILLVCSGEKGRIAYDDVYAAGFAVNIIKQKKDDIVLSDSALIVLNNSKTESSICEALKRSVSYRSMLKAGLGDDIKICCMTDLYDITGKLQIQNERQTSGFEEDGNPLKISNKVPGIFKVKPYKL